MRYAIVAAMVLFAFVVGNQTDDIFRIAHHTINDIARETRYWIASILS